jgi:hypothetical protein
MHPRQRPAGRAASPGDDAPHVSERAVREVRGRLGHATSRAAGRAARAGDAPTSVSRQFDGLLARVRLVAGSASPATLACRTPQAIVPCGRAAAGRGAACYGARESAPDAHEGPPARRAALSRD